MELVFSADGPLSRRRRSLGLPEVRHELLTNALRVPSCLLPVSPAWFPPPSDWPLTTVLTGFIPWEQPESSLPDDVRAYLDDDDPPVLVTLGTSAATNATEAFGLIATTLDDLGVRGIFLVGDESEITGPLRDRPGVWPFVPLHLVLPRCRAVVHSALLGTTGTVLVSGLPSLATPLLFDQIWNVYRTAELGAGLVLRTPSRKRALALVGRLLTDRVLEQTGCVASRRDSWRALAGSSRRRCGICTRTTRQNLAVKTNKEIRPGDWLPRDRMNSVGSCWRAQYSANSVRCRMAMVGAVPRPRHDAAQGT